MFCLSEVPIKNVLVKHNKLSKSYKLSNSNLKKKSNSNPTTNNKKISIKYFFRFKKNEYLLDQIQTLQLKSVVSRCFIEL